MAIFVDKWMSTSLSPKQSKAIIKTDWDIYLDKGFRKLLHNYPNATENEIDEVWKLRGIKMWLEDELILRLVLAVRLAKMPIGDVEVGILVNSLGMERAQKVVDTVAFLMSRMKK